MGLMKGDMGGAAVVCATMMAIADLKLPINVVGLTPLCENMPSGNAYKPGDVVTAMNGTTIEVCILLVTCGISCFASHCHCMQTQSHECSFNIVLLTFLSHDIVNMLRLFLSPLSHRVVFIVF